jgi:hypothetical protein
MDSLDPSVVATLRSFNTGSRQFLQVKAPSQQLRFARAQSSEICREQYSFSGDRSRWSLTSLVTQEDEPVAVVQSYSAIRHTGAIVYRGVLAACDVFKIAKT